jgi:hypothetical protein
MLNESAGEIQVSVALKRVYASVCALSQRYRWVFIAFNKALSTAQFM